MYIRRPKAGKNEQPLVRQLGRKKKRFPANRLMRRKKGKTLGSRYLSIYLIVHHRKYTKPVVCLLEADGDL